MPLILKKKLFKKSIWCFQSSLMFKSLWVYLLDLKRMRCGSERNWSKNESSRKESKVWFSNVYRIDQHFKEVVVRLTEGYKNTECCMSLNIHNLHLDFFNKAWETWKKSIVNDFTKTLMPCKGGTRATGTRCGLWLEGIKTFIREKCGAQSTSCFKYYIFLYRFDSFLLFNCTYFKRLSVTGFQWIITNLAITQYTL